MTEETTSKDIKECGCDSTPKETPKEVPKEVTASTQEFASKADFEKVLSNYNEQQVKLAALEAELKGNVAIPKPMATVPELSGNAPIGSKEFAEKTLKKLKENGYAQIELPYEELRSMGVTQFNSPHGVRESFSRNYRGGMNIAETASGITISTSAGVASVDPTVAFVPGGITFAPIRQYCKFKSLQKGQTSAKFLKSTLPSTGSQTAGTTATAATQTITSVSATPSTITGVFQYVNTDIEENEPEDILATTLNSAMMTILNYEATNLLQTTAAEANLTAGAWYKGDGSSTTALVNSEVGNVQFDYKGIALGYQYLANQGYLRDGTRPVVFVHPQQLREMLTASDITTYAQYAKPQITDTGMVQSIWGTDIVVTNAIEAKTNTTTNAYNAIMCVPQHTFGAAVAREAKVILHQFGEDNQIRANVTWRFTTTTIDDTSAVRLSTKQ